MPEMTREEKIALIERRKAEAAEDPVAFIDHFLWTFNPNVEPYHHPFKLFPFQKERIVEELMWAIENGEDIFFDKTREMGGTYTILAVLLWYWKYIPGSNFLLGSRKQDAVDNTKDVGDAVATNKDESLFGKLEYMLSNRTVNGVKCGYPEFMLPKGFVFRKHFGFMSLTNPENGNVISGESSNPNFSRGGRNKAVLLDEFAFWENDTAAWGATADTTRCRIVLTTPGIRPSKAKRLRFGEDGEKIKIIELPYYLDPRKNQAWLDYQRSRRSQEDFDREIMMNWETSVRGRVYPEIANAKVGTFPYNPLWPLYVGWDFGLDGLAIQFWQFNMKKGIWRIVEAYKTEDQPIQYALPLFPKNPIDSLFLYSSEDLEVFRKTSTWKKGIHYGDPDVAKRSLISVTKESTRSVLEKAGVYVQTKPESNDFPTRRSKTKVFLQKGIEVNDTPGTRVWMKSMSEARYPQRSENSQATTPITLPIHNWTSHHRTATEYLAVNVDEAYGKEDDKYKEFENWKDPNEE